MKLEEGNLRTKTIIAQNSRLSQKLFEHPST
jgi:hypothetical protein